MLRLPIADVCRVRLPASTMAVQAEPCVLGSVAVKAPLLAVVTVCSLTLPSARWTAVRGNAVQVLPLRYWTDALSLAFCPYLR